MAVQLLQHFGPGALGAWCDGKASTRGMAETSLIALHSVSTLGFAAAAGIGYYVYAHPTLLTTDECSRLATFILMTSIAITAVLLFSLLTAFFARGPGIVVFNAICCNATGHVFQLVLNTIASVWVFSTPGKYFPDTCSTTVVSGIRVYLLCWWAYVLFAVISLFVTAAMSDKFSAQQFANDATARQPLYDQRAILRDAM